MFLDDFGASPEMRAEDDEDRPFWFKLDVGLARLTAPVQHDGNIAGDHRAGASTG